MKAVSLVGPKNSGKTTLGLKLARELTAMGLRVAAAKFSHHDLTWPDTDTAQYAGVCVAVAGLGPDESFVHWTRKRALVDLLPLLRADVLLVEGGKSLGWLPRILCLPQADDPDAAWLRPDLALASTGPGRAHGVPRQDSPAALAATVCERGFLLPGLDCQACGRPDCRTLAGQIVRGEASPEACAALHNALAVDIDGVPLAMKPFVENLLSAAIREMLRSLKGAAPGTATIRLRV